jgi:hypothetical protein
MRYGSAIKVVVIASVLISTRVRHLYNDYSDEKYSKVSNLL